MKLRQLIINPIIPLSVGRFPTCSVQGSRQLGPDPLERLGAWEWGGSLTGSWHLPLVAAVTQPHPCCLPEQPGAVACSRSTTYTNTVNDTLSTISAFVLIVNKSKNVPLNNRSLQTSETFFPASHLNLYNEKPTHWNYGIYTCMVTSRLSNGPNTPLNKKHAISEAIFTANQQSF